MDDPNAASARAPEPESERPANPLEITDPRAMRALAHPARIAILQHLVFDGPATATECAEVAGLSPSACSYHLRALARYGFVEEELAEAADGRHRPWRARLVSITFGRNLDRPDVVRAAERMLLETYEAELDELRAVYRDRETAYPREWQAAAGTRMDVLHVTPAELTEIRARIDRLLEDYERLSPQDRPPGAGRVTTVVDFTPWFEPGPAQ
jgi:DNA-binding transcriptional ArsR family regulator